MALAGTAWWKEETIVIHTDTMSNEEAKYIPYGVLG